MTVEEMLSKIDSRELSEWQAYFILTNEEAKQEHQRQKNKQKLRR